MVDKNFEHLVMEQGKKVFKSVYCMLGDLQDTEDVVQEIFLQACLSLPAFKGRSSISTWLYRIAMNVVSDYFREKRKIVKLNDAMSFEDSELLGRIEARQGSIEDGYVRKELNEFIHKALMIIPPQFRAVFVLKEIDGYSYREIADILEISVGTVESRLFRARRLLRARISGIASDEGENYETLQI